MIAIGVDAPDAAPVGAEQAVLTGAASVQQQQDQMKLTLIR